MFIYLDQNKWIELARMFHGKDRSARAQKVLSDIQVAKDCGYKFPLSAIHMMELARIRDNDKRARLGEVMWHYSEGTTIAPLRAILKSEMPSAFRAIGYDVPNEEFGLIGTGMAHAFGEILDSPVEASIGEQLDKAMLCGMPELNIPPVQGGSNKHRENFQSHLNSIHKDKDQLDPGLWDNWLYAMAMLDIAEPLWEFTRKHGIDHDHLFSSSEEMARRLLDNIPTRRVDIHLHRQFLKNPELRSKLSDLEDWAALGPAVCYCDVVVCEKHFASLLSRDGFKVQARVETDIDAIIDNLANVL